MCPDNPRVFLSCPAVVKRIRLCLTIELQMLINKSSLFKNKNNNQRTKTTSPENLFLYLYLETFSSTLDALWLSEKVIIYCIIYFNWCVIYIYKNETKNGTIWIAFYFDCLLFISVHRRNIFAGFFSRLDVEWRNVFKLWRSLSAFDDLLDSRRKSQHRRRLS